MTNDDNAARELDAATQAEFRRALDGLPGQPCWSVIAGAGTGSIVSLDFGDKVARARRIANPYLREDQRQYLGALSLFIECAWRLDGPDRVICAWTNANDNDGPMVRGLDALTDSTVESVLVRRPAMDLTLAVTGGLTLHVFCDSAAPDAHNYSFYTPEAVYSVGAKGALTRERRAPAGTR